MKRIVFKKHIAANQPENLLRNKFILVLGAESGIGASIASNMANAGAHL